MEGLQLGLSAGEAQPPKAGSVVLNSDVKGDVDKIRASLEKKGVKFPEPTWVIAGKVRLAGSSTPTAIVFAWRARTLRRESSGTAYKVGDERRRVFVGLIQQHGQRH